MPAKLIIGYQVSDVGVGTLRGESRSIVEIDLPEIGDEEVLKKVIQDCSIISESLQGDNETFKRLSRAMKTGELGEAAKCLRKLKLSEEEVEERGGGWLHLLAVVAVGTVVRMWPRTAHAPMTEIEK